MTATIKGSPPGALMVPMMLGTHAEAQVGN